MPDSFYDQIIQSITYSKLRITFEAVDEIRFDFPYKGSAFRGCLLNSFMETVCLLQNRPSDCKVCHVRFQCLFYRFSVNELQPTHPLFGRYTTPPQAYILDPMRDSDLVYHTGKQFWMDIILIGEAIEQYSPLLPALFIKMGERGMGGQRGRFKPVSLKYKDANGNFHDMPAIGSPSILDIPDVKVNSSDQTLTINFETPVRFLSEGDPKFKPPENVILFDSDGVDVMEGKIVNPPEFDLFLKSILTRLSLLSNVYCNSQIAGFEGNLKALHSGIVISSHNLKWRRVLSSSSRREKEGTVKATKYDGFINTISYKGDFAPWLKFIAAGEILHVGSTATFGLGKYSIMKNE